jgi:hypothetical protein
MVPHKPGGDTTNAAECETCWHCAGTGDVPEGGHMTEAAVISEMRLWLERSAEEARRLFNRSGDSHECSERLAESYAYREALEELNRLRCYLMKGGSDEP